jgi:lipopolysaccharide transport system permease protein
VRFCLDAFKLLFTSLWYHRALVGQMVRREVVGRYRGSVIGLLWSFLHPVLMLSVFTFVFSEVFRMKWSVGQQESKIDFALILFVGLIVHGVFAECLNRAPGLILQNTNFVKKVVFPLEILPWVAMGVTLFHAVISILVWLLLFILVHGHIQWTILLLPVVIAPLVVLAMGCAWFLAATGVFLRDVGQTTGIVTTILLFISPVFFPASAFPERYRWLLDLNPLTFPIEQAREVMFWGRAPDGTGLLIYLVAAVLFAFLGLAWFQKTRRGFADVL